MKQECVCCQTITEQWIVQNGEIRCRACALAQPSSGRGKKPAGPSLFDDADRAALATAIKANTLQPKKKRKPAAASQPNSVQVDALYAIYPRKVGPIYAKTCIAKAIARVAEKRKTDFMAATAWLIERVGRYAKARAGQDRTKTPHPSTWFNQGRYDDDEAEWQADGGGPDRGAAPTASGTGRRPLHSARRPHHRGQDRRGSAAG